MPSVDGAAGAGDDLAGCLVAAHGVDGDRQHRDGRCALSRRRRRRGPCTSRRSGTPCAAAWRRRSAGRCCAPGRSSFQAPARRLRVFDFDFFFLGTATAGLRCRRYRAVARLSPDERRIRYGRGVSRVELVERRPARVDLGRRRIAARPGCRSMPHVGHSPAQSGRHSGVVGEVPSSTSSRTIGREVDLVADDRERIGVGDAVLVQLVHLDDDVPLGRRQAPPARAAPRRRRRVPVTTMPSVSDSRRRSTSTSTSASNAAGRRRRARPRRPASVDTWRCAAGLAQQFGGVDRAAGRMHPGYGRRTVSGPGRRSPCVGSSSSIDLRCRRRCTPIDSR